MSNEKLSHARKLCAELQSALLDLAVDYTIVSKNSSHNKPVTKLLCRCVKYIEGVSGRSIKGDKLLKDLYVVLAQLRNR